MRRFLLAVVVGAACVATSSSQARDERLRFPIQDAVAAAGTRLDDRVKFYWGGQKVPEGAKLLGTYTANKKTNFFNKSDKEGCEWAWLSAMITLQERALREGGNAVVNVQSVYRNAEFVSETEYECGAGSVVGGVALRGTVAKVP